MPTKRTSKSEQRSDAELLAARLRQARLDRGLTLLGVQDLTQGTVRAASLSAYELGDVSIPALRLALLARLYEVPIESFFASSVGGVPAPAHPVPLLSVGQVVHIDLVLLAKAKSQEAKMVAHLVDWIKPRRSASAGRYFAMRRDDLSGAAASNGRDVEDIIASLQKEDVLRRPRGRPLGRRI